jgi:hypothetical protein
MKDRGIHTYITPEGQKVVMGSDVGFIPSNIVVIWP